MGTKGWRHTVHVLLIPSFYPTASKPTHGVFFRDQARALVEAGFTVGVLSCVELAPWQEREFWTVWRIRTSYFDDGGIRTIQRPVRRWWPGRHRPRVEAWLRTGMELFDAYLSLNGRPALLHAHVADPAGLLAAQLKSLHGIPFVLTEHASWLARGTKGRVSESVAAAAIREADAAIAVSPDLARRLADRFLLPKGGWGCVPNAVDPAFLRLPLPSSPGSLRHGFSFLCVAHLVPVKGHALLLEAFARAFRGDEAVSLRLVGGGPLRRRLNRLARALGITPQVRLLGPLPRSRVLTEVERCDAVVLASGFETFGVALIEGMAAGKPVVATRCGGPDSIVTPSSGLLVDVGDVGGLAEALGRMRESIRQYDPTLIRADAERRFGYAAVSSALKDIYRGVTRGDGPDRQGQAPESPRQLGS